MGLLVCTFCMIGVFIPKLTSATTYEEDVQTYLASQEGRAVIAQHVGSDGMVPTYKYTLNNSTNMITVEYVDGYTTSIHYKVTEPSTPTTTDPVKSDYIVVNGYNVPRYIMESEDSVLNAREVYMKYHGDPSKFDADRVPDSSIIPSKIDNNGNAVSMNKNRTTNCWLDGKYYDSEGYNITGWKSLNNIWYYFSGDGISQRGWFYNAGKWYYLNPKDGSLAIGWQYINKTWYYLNTNGTMFTGWLSGGNNTWYYLNSNGSMATGWIKDNGKWYYLNTNGVMRTAWLLNNSKWYYMNPNDGAMVTGWIKDSKRNDYFLKSDGSMQTANFKLNNINYKVDSSGRCTATK